MDLTTLILLMLVPELLFILFMFWYLRLHLIFKGIEVKLNVTPTMLIGMRLRRVNPDLIILNAVKLLKAGVNLQVRSEELLQILEGHFLAGGNVARVTAALLEAKNRAASLSLSEARAIDLKMVCEEEKRNNPQSS